VISALTQREQLTEIVELPQSVHPWFIGVQFHPEFKSTPWDGHPLFNAFIKAALDHQTARLGQDNAGAQAEGCVMKLCGFDIGLDKPFFLMAGRRRSAARGAPGASLGIGPRRRMRAGGARSGL
jgi:hypothetical protein